ncbi:MAG: aminotransferase class I/II-fold pyridoxal phosphate-dependent enzyme [Kiritimatiellia bacterium]|nr:aminotransferase class I/II-fold pyridoxal phosphate-dependent enzyme [Kiritimatiellia bacterium]MDP6630850.1 aminotransferase class I/II-fold pyridoxal phosphate-dependent enzyme [Kiritimatiellia bacterium]MDP6811271.1 aminotransferase class I/II-fold pyridoxal phosphate-dependent enzyme [Kiritimatiellia bacterium]MDP7024115.1 aminotransferase class I/II-fold pyridoxal phosphate-dependent enzyme [Kiritimatiellia bacterium]
MSDSKSPRDFVASHVSGMPRSGIRDFFGLVSEREGVISLSIGEPDFVTPWHIREAAIWALEHGATSYTSNLGMMRLRRAIASYVKRSHGLAYDPVDEVLVTVGVSEALDLAMRAIIEPGDEVIYHEPCYVSYSPVITLAFGTPVPVSTKRETGFRLRREDIEPVLTEKSKVLVLNFPTNPTGGILTREDLGGIAALACEHDLLVISDEVYSELTYEAERVSIASLPGMRERTIFLNGLSKAWAMTGFRMGYACAPPVLVEAMMKIHQYSMLCAPILSQEASVEALKNGDSDVVEMREAYDLRRHYIHKSLNDMGLPCHLPGGAFYAFPCIGDTGLTSHDFSMRLLEEENVACVPGTAFGPSGEGYLRCSYATAMDEIEQAMERMQRFVSAL